MLTELDNYHNKNLTINMNETNDLGGKMIDNKENINASYGAFGNQNDVIGKY